MSLTQSRNKAAALKLVILVAIRMMVCPFITWKDAVKAQRAPVPCWGLAAGGWGQPGATAACKQGSVLVPSPCNPSQCKARGSAHLWNYIYLFSALLCSAAVTTLPIKLCLPSESLEA